LPKPGNKPAESVGFPAVTKQLDKLGRQVLAGERLSRGEAFALSELGPTRPYDLLYWAHRLRQQNFGSAVRLCSIAAGKLGACGEDCKWCAQSAGAAPQRIESAEIVAAAKSAAAKGASSFGIVNSGRRPNRRDLREVTDVVRQIRTDQECNLQICASLGELTDDQANFLADGGVTRYNHNLETSRRFFRQVVTTHTYEDRLRTLTAARRAGMMLCCGGIFGLGETWGDRIELALTLRDQVRPQVVPLNFLHPIPGTPLENADPLRPLEILSIIAIFRLLLPTVDLKIAGGREVNLRDLQSWMFYAGATSCIIGKYLTTPGRSSEQDLRMISDLDLTVVPELTNVDELTKAH